MRRLLFVDDELEAARAVVRWMRLVSPAEFAIDLVSDPGEALAWIDAGGRFDAVLCDYAMPSLSGVAFYKRAIASWPELRHRIVFFSGGIRDPDDARFIADEHLPLVRKPLLLREEALDLIALLSARGLQTQA